MLKKRLQRVWGEVFFRCGQDSQLNFSAAAFEKPQFPFPLPFPLPFPFPESDFTTEAPVASIKLAIFLFGSNGIAFGVFFFAE